MTDSEQDALANVLMKFHADTKNASGTREELKCLNNAIDEIDRLLSESTPVDGDAVEKVEGRARQAYWDGDPGPATGVKSRRGINDYIELLPGSVSQRRSTPRSVRSHPMPSDLRRFIRREIGCAYDNGHLAATVTTVTTRAQIVDSYTQRILDKMCAEMTTPDALAAGGRGIPLPNNAKRVVSNVTGYVVGAAE